MKLLLILCILCKVLFATSLDNSMLSFKNAHLGKKSYQKQMITKKVAIGSEKENYKRCFKEAAVHYEISPKLLEAIARVESKMNPNAIAVNNNGTYDIGIMQINSSWFPRLAKVGVQRGELLDGCTNIMVGAWILKQNINKYGLTITAIGKYNSPNQHLGYLYASRVIKTYLDD